MSKTRCSLFDVKTNDCPCSCRGIREDVSTIDVQDANVFYKANIRHNNCKTEVRCLRALQSVNKFLRDSYDSHVKRPFVLRCILNHFNMVKPEANARSPNTYGQLWPRLNVLMYINNKLVSFTLFFFIIQYFFKRRI